jgi:hypothetical protein
MMVRAADNVNESVWAIVRVNEATQAGLVSDVHIVAASGSALMTLEGVRTQDPGQNNAAAAADIYYETLWMPLDACRETSRDWSSSPGGRTLTIVGADVGLQEAMQGRFPDATFVASADEAALDNATQVVHVGGLRPEASATVILNDVAQLLQKVLKQTSDIAVSVVTTAASCLRTTCVRKNCRRPMPGSGASRG